MNGKETIRMYDPDDREGFVSLYDTVFGLPNIDEWFTWKYEDNPYVDDVPIVIAGKDGRIVGAMPFFVLRMRANGRELTGRMPADLMVHPEYRRQGIFSRMSVFSSNRQWDDDETVFFGYPNPPSLPGWLQTGYELIGSESAHYRIQRPGTLIESQFDVPAIGAMKRAVTAVTQGYFGVRDQLRTPPEDISVHRFEDIRADFFASLYQQHVPSEIHTVRNELYYNWRFGNPRWDYTTYVATDPAGPVAGAIVGTQTLHDEVTVQVTDAVPLDGGSTDAWRSILSEVISKNQAADIVSAPSDVLPEEVLSSLGFVDRDAILLKNLLNDSPLIVRTPDDVDSTIYGMDVREEQNWLLSFSDRDTS